MKWRLLLISLYISVYSLAQETNYTIERIWDAAPHNAFTDLVRYGDKYYCAFREATGHIPEKDNTGNGCIRLLVSENGEKWTSYHLFSKTGYDLRDPKLTVTPDNRLMILTGGSVYDKCVLQNRQPFVIFMDKKGNFTDITPIEIDPQIATSNDWLWRVTWHKKTGYGTVYQMKEKEDWKLFLVKTTDGIRYELITQLNVAGKPNEASIVIQKNKMHLIVRREGADLHGYIGESTYPFTQWEWHDLGIRFGGPELTRMPNGKLLLSTRSYYGKIYRMSLYEINKNNKPELLLDLPSEKDTGYPGILIRGKELWVSYNSGHEDKTAIYLAKFPDWRSIWKK